MKKSRPLFRTLALVTSVSLLLAACTRDPVPSNRVAVVEVTAPNDLNLKLNDTANFSAVVKAADGTVITGQKVTWASSHPDVASVDENGVVTAKRFGEATILAKVGSVQGKATTLRTYGLEAFVGLRDNNIDTALFLRYRTANGQKPAADRLSFTVSGPAGWNAGQTVELDVANSTYFTESDGSGAHWFEFGWTKTGSIPAVVGDYRVTFKVDGQEWPATARLGSLTNSSRTPTNIRVTGYDGASVNATWDDVVPNGSYQAAVRGYYPPTYVNSSTASLRATGLPAGQEAVVEVHALTLDIAAPVTTAVSGPFDVRYNTLTFTPSGTSATNALRLMPLGDSITDGYNIPGGYRMELFQKLSAQVPKLNLVGSLQNGPSTLADRDHEGHSGWRIDEIAAQVNGWLDTHQPKTVLLLIGTNDLIQGYDVANAPARLGALLDQITARRPDARVLVASLPPLADAAQNARVVQFNAALPALVKARADQGKKVTFVDAGAALTLADLADGVHPDAGGYSKLAGVWHDALVGTPDALTP